MAALIALLLVTSAYSLFAPFATDGVKYVSNGSIEEFSMPLLDLSTLSGRMEARFTLNIPSDWTPRVFMRYYRNHTPIDFITVNGVGLAFHPDQFTHDFSSVLHTGDNTVVVTMHVEDDNPSFVFGLEPSRATLLPWIYFFLCAAIILLWFYFLEPLILGAGLRFEVRAFLLVGVLLRAGYAFAVPYYVANPDVIGHVAYLRYVAAHWTVPLTFSSWQAHQAPLYYFLGAPFMLLGERFGLGEAQALLAVQQLSVLLTILTLLIGTRLVHRYFGGDRMRIALGTLFLCTFPSLLYLASQVNNDVLVTLLGFLWFERLVHAVQKNRLLDWGIVGLVAGLGLLTKGNAILWLPATFIAPFLASGSIRQRGTAAASVVLVSLLVFAPLFLWRQIGDPHFGVVANAPFLRGMTFLDPTIKEILTFNPAKILSFGYRTTGYLAGTNFIETIFLTAQFGTADFGPESSILLALGLFLLPLLFFGIIRSCRDQRFVPALAFFLFLGGMLLYRLRFPYGSSQNFRYIVTACLPLTLLLAEGTAFWRIRIVRILSEMIMIVYALVSFILFFGIFIAT
jgi:hypothetical protein